MMTDRLRSNSTIAPPVFQWFNSFKEFMGYQIETLSPFEAVRLYEMYKKDFRELKVKENFLSLVNSLGICKDRYSPEGFSKLIGLTSLHAKPKAAEFLKSMQNGQLDVVNLSMKFDTLTEIENMFTHNDFPGKRIVGTLKFENKDLLKDFGHLFPLVPRSLNETLVLKQLNPFVTLDMLNETCKTFEYIEKVTLMPSCFCDESYTRLLSLLNNDFSDIDEAEIDELNKFVYECYVKEKLPDHLVTNDSKNRSKDNKFFLPLNIAYVEFKDSESCDEGLMSLAQRSIGDLCVAKPQKMRESQSKLNRLRVVPEYANEEEIQKDFDLICNLILTFDILFDLNIKDTDSSELENFRDSMAENEQTELMTDTNIVDTVEKNKNNSADQSSSDNLSQSKTRKNADSYFLNYLNTLDYPLLKKLDSCIIYLRHVYFFDFYSSRFCWNEREYYELCAAATVRVFFNDGSHIVPKNSSSIDFSIFQQNINAIINEDYEIFLKPLNEEHAYMQPLWKEICDNHTVPEGPERFKCTVCQKMFKGTEFVAKHLKNKHREMLDSILEKIVMQSKAKLLNLDNLKNLIILVNLSDYPSSRKNVTSKEPVSSIGPIRRDRGYSIRSIPINRRDWDAPSNRLEHRSCGGNFRTMMRYEDI